MKYQISVSRGVRSWISAGLLALAITAIPAQSFSQVTTLTDNGASATINQNGSNAGMTDWTVGGFHPLSLQWFWYRVGATPEQKINSLSTATVATTSASQSRLSYANAQYGVSIEFKLQGVSPSESFITESITVSNKTASAITFSLFQYSDFNLGPGATDGVQIGLNNFSQPNEAFQTNGLIRLAESNLDRSASHAEAALLGATLSKLNDGVADNLNDNLSAGPGDVTWAFQWDLPLAAGQSTVFSLSKHIVVPEPSGMALMTLGTIVCAIYRRRKN